MSRAIGMSSIVGGRDYHVWKDRQWLNPVNNAAEPGPEKSMDLAFRNKAAGFTEVEPRAWFSTDYYSISPGMVSLTPGKGAFYAIAFDDCEGKPLSGDVSYTLTLPPNVPAKLFWSVTLYEAENASGLATEARRFPSLGSRDKPIQNADGATEIYIGPKPPAGKEANWLATAPGRGFFSILRLYGPENPPSTTAGSRGTSRTRPPGKPGETSRRLMIFRIVGFFLRGAEIRVIVFNRRPTGLDLRRDWTAAGEGLEKPAWGHGRVRRNLTWRLENF